MKILLDTNTLFSALGYPGNERDLIFKMIDANWDIAIIDRILEELQENIRRKYTSPQKEMALDLLLTFLRRGNIEIKRLPEYQHHLDEAKTLTNEEDAVILAAAMLSDVDILVTGDKHFLENERLKDFPKVKISSTVEALALFAPKPEQEAPPSASKGWLP